MARFSRRDVLRGMAASLAGTFLSACRRAIEPPAGFSTRAPQPTLPSVTTSPPTPTVSSPVAATVPIISNQDFYTIAAGPVPVIPPDWKLTLTGLVEQPLALTLDEIKTMPSVTEMRTLECIENPVGGYLISNAMWKGVRLSDLLAQAGVKSNARYLQLHSFDGYSTGISLELGMDEHALLVYEMNGEPLPSGHGAPLRCLWPGRYGMKQPKWLESITLIEQSYYGYWETQGWSREAKIRPFSRIDAPRDSSVVSGSTFTLSGLAFSDETGLAQVEISWDDTDQWQAAELTRGPSPYTWATWTWMGPALLPGRHKLYARATDGSGQAQTRERASNYLGGVFPSGADQMQWIALEFV